jgi:hypothetical protein
MLRTHLVFLLSLSFVCASCGQNTEQTPGSDDNAVPGTVQTTAEFSILVPEGWEFVDFGNAALQTYSKDGAFIVEVKQEGLNMTEGDVKATLESLRKQYNGSPLQTMDMLGLRFFMTTYDVQSMHQSKYTALKDGKKFSITLSGPAHETDPVMQAVFASIKIR